MSGFDADALRARFEAYLAGAVARVCGEADLAKAMDYSLMAGGKRLRPMMLLAANAMFGGDEEGALPFAAALEMIHTYSLIHDDLPAMDNDSLRRGRPTSHVVFGEAQAILAGDGLLNGAMETMAEACLAAAPERREGCLKAMTAVARCAGSRGMILGQWLDMDGTGRAIGRDALERMHMNKTGALFLGALTAGGALAGASAAGLDALAAYARAFGMVFQMTDDILDVTGDAAKLGKSIGKDAEEGKSTYVTLLGLAETEALAARYTEEAAAALAPLEGPEAEWLTAQVRGLLHRDH